MVNLNLKIYLNSCSFLLWRNLRWQARRSPRSLMNAQLSSVDEKGSSCKVKSRHRDGSGGGPFNAQVSNRVIGCESEKGIENSEVRIEPVSFLPKGPSYRAFMLRTIMVVV